MMKILLSILLIIVSFSFGFSQVGINTTDPDASAALDIVNDERGVLIPRMTTAQKNAIVEPAHSLLVYDTGLEGYYFNQGTPTTPNWIPLLSDKDQRDNYVLVKSESDFPAASSGGTINLNEDTYYEINGEITLSASINLNNAYVSGLDATEDVLSYPGGTVFVGNTGGSIRNVTIQGSQAFNITGPGITTSSSLLLQNSVVAGNTTVGTIANLGLVFSNIVQFINNQGGITYSNIGNLLLNNQAWLDSNSGTYETFTGIFGFIEKVSGFSTVGSGAVGLDVSSNPTVNSSGTLLGTVFSGSGTYVNPYNSGDEIYTGYNFNNKWTVNSPGIKREEDDVTTANIYYSSSNIVTLNNSTPIKLPVTTTITRNFRASARSGVNSSNSFVYKGNKDKVVNVFGSISFTAIGGMRCTFSVYKNGSLVPGSQVVYDVVDTNARQGLSIVATVEVEPNDFLEIYVERDVGSSPNQFLVTSYNLLFN